MSSQTVQANTFHLYIFMYSLHPVCFVVETHRNIFTCMLQRFNHASSTVPVNVESNNIFTITL